MIYPSIIFITYDARMVYFINSRYTSRIMYNITIDYLLSHIVHKLEMILPDGL